MTQKGRVAVTLAGRRLVIDTDDASILPQLFVAFGRDDGRELSPFLHAAVVSEGGLRNLRVRRAGSLVPPLELFFGLEEPDCPYRLAGSSLVYGDGEPQFTVCDDRLVVHDTSTWREAVAALLWRQFFRCIEDTIFFHAAAVGIDGKGVLLIGAQHAGKSTTALALAARGHDFLSDEYGCYEPASHELIPYRRPVGIRPGPKASAIEHALERGGYYSVQDEDSLRVDLSELLPLAPERSLTLHSVIFIAGQDGNPALRYVDPGRAEMGMLQTLYSSLSNAAHARRAFEMVRLLSRSRVAYLTIGDPDRTAAFLEKELGS